MPQPTPLAAPADTAPNSPPPAAEAVNLDDAWPWAPQGRQVPAMFADNEMLEILMPHGPLLPKGQVSFGRLRKRIEHTPGAGEGPFVDQLGRIMADPAARDALLEQADDIEGLGSCMVTIARTCIAGLYGPQDPASVADRFARTLEELRKKAKSGTKREARRWHVCGVAVAVVVSRMKRDEPFLVLHEVATHWPELLPFLLPPGFGSVSAEAVLAAKAPQVPAAPSPLTLLEARQAELAALAAGLEKSVAEQRTLEERDQRPVPLSERAAARHQQAEAWDAWTATYTALGERVGKACPAAPPAASSTPSALLVTVKIAQGEAAKQLTDLHQTADVAKRLLGLRSQAIHVPSPQVAAAMTQWLLAETARVVDDTHPDHPVLRLPADHEQVRKLTVLCNLIAEAPTMGVKSLVMNDMHILAMGGAFHAPAPTGSAPDQGLADRLADSQLEVLALQECVLELEDILKRKDWEIACLRQGSTPEEMRRPAERPAPRTVTDAVAHAMTDFADDLVFLDSARASAANSPFQNVGLVYKHLEGMAKLSAMWRAAPDGKLNKGFKEAFRELGLPDYRGQISDTASGKFGQEYLFIHKGQKLEFKEHFTLGSKDPNTCLSIHFYRDTAERRLVVGHVGRHLSNTKS